MAFTGLNDITHPDASGDADVHPTKTDTPPRISEPENDEAAVEGPSDPSKRAAPPTVLFTAAGGVREGPSEQNIPDEIPTIVASPMQSHAGLPSTTPGTGTGTGTRTAGTTTTTAGGDDLPASARMPNEMSPARGGRQDSLSVPVTKDTPIEGEKPRLSAESDIRPEGTGTKRMFQLSKRFSESPLYLDLFSPLPSPVSSPTIEMSTDAGR